MFTCWEEVSKCVDDQMSIEGEAYDLARVLRRFLLRRLTRFFLHFALILITVAVLCVSKGSRHWKVERSNLLVKVECCDEDGRRKEKFELSISPCVGANTR